ncbi:MAG: hypothetical protein U0935_13070 [Pirellulales bacterium]
MAGVRNGRARPDHASAGCHGSRWNRQLTVLEVAGQRWQEVESFFGRGPDEPVFVTYHDDQQRLHIRGGDGRTGRRFPSGRENILSAFSRRCESGNAAGRRTCC